MVAYIILSLLGLIVLAIVKILRGLSLNLYLLNHDSLMQDQSVIPLTPRMKAVNPWKSLWKRSWATQVEVTLRDYDGNALVAEVDYHLWKGFRLRPLELQKRTTLNKEALKRYHLYVLKNGQRLTLGNREFDIRLLPFKKEQELLLQ